MQNETFFQISNYVLQVNTCAKLDNVATKYSLVALGARQGSLDVHVILSGFGGLGTGGGRRGASLQHRE